MHTGLFWQAVYWFSLPVLAILTGVLLWRRIPRELPLFFSYVAAGFLVDAARLLAFLSGSRIIYFNTYWISEAVGTLFGLLATWELILLRLFPQFHRVRFYRYLFSFAAVAIATFSVMTGYLHRTPLLLPVLMKSLHALDFLRVALLIFFVGLMVFMGREWSRYEFGIALGLGLNAAAFLASLAVLTKRVNTWFNEVPVFAYDAACLIWLISFLRPPKPLSVPTAPISPEVLEEAKKWQETLKESLVRKKDPD